jgi:hypothetical protein
MPPSLPLSAIDQWEKKDMMTILNVNDFPSEYGERNSVENHASVIL